MFAYAKGIGGIAVGGFSGAPPVAFVPNRAPLDITATAALAAFGLRRLRTAYAGQCLRVRRSGDNAESDFGFDAIGILDVASVEAFCVAGGGTQHGYVVTWYDQGAIGNHFSQATTARQPQIVESGIVKRAGPRPSVWFDGTDDHLFRATSGLYASGACTIFSTILGAGQDNRRIISEGRSTIDDPIYAVSSETGGSPNDDAYVFIRNNASATVVYSKVGSAVFNGQHRVHTMIDTGSNLAGRVNGININSAAYTRSGTLTLDRICMGGLLRTAFTFPYLGYISEVIAFGAALTDAQQSKIVASSRLFHKI